MFGAENIAAVFVEPTAGSIGCLPPPKGYLDRLRKICDDNGILLVFDEVICGWGRMGDWFGAQAFGVTPDIMTMAKALTNGAQPMGAVAAREHIYNAITDAGPERGVEFFHGYTYSGHPAACAAGLAMMDIFAKDDLVGQAAALSPYFIEQMHTFEEFDCVTDVRTIGVMAGIELKPDGAPGQRGHAVQKDLFDNGLHQKNTGDVLIIAPPLTSTKEHVDEIVGKLRGVISKL